MGLYCSLRLPLERVAHGGGRVVNSVHEAVSEVH